ncbi:hypothetical protein J7K93_14260 [bacterium]|nr:hypothetical protein [bacterium]
MVKKKLIPVIVIMLIPLVAGFGADGKLGIGFRASSLKSVKGTFRDNVAMSDYVNSAAGYGLIIRQQISKGFSVELGVDYGFMKLSQNCKIDESKNPGWVLPRISASNIVPIVRWIVVPSVKFGVDIVPWRFTEDGPKGETSLFEGEKVQKMSFGLHGGVELEIPLAKWISLIAEGRYTYLFCRDNFFFGETFSEQGLFSFSAGVTVFPF